MSRWTLNTTREPDGSTLIGNSRICDKASRTARCEAVRVPVASYQVSGEYAMLQDAAEKGHLDLERAMWETALGMRRAGADLLITYFARALAERLIESRRAAESAR